MFKIVEITTAGIEKLNEPHSSNPHSDAKQCEAAVARPLQPHFKHLYRIARNFCLPKKGFDHFGDSDVCVTPPRPLQTTVKAVILLQSFPLTPVHVRQTIGIRGPLREYGSTL